MKSLSDFDFNGRKVLMRCDFNVPLSLKGEILDDFRIERTIPTIKYLVQKGAKLVLMSHLEPEKGKIVQMTPVQEKLMEYLNLSIAKAPDCVGQEVESLVRKMQPGEILLLENLRFHRGEKENNEGFAKALAQLGDIYINDAFGVCHRNHASLTRVPKYLPCGAGFLLEKEIEMLTRIRENPARPLIVLVGGVLKEKEELIFLETISQIADRVLIGSLIKKTIEERNFSFQNSEKIAFPVREDIDAFDLGPNTLRIFQEKISQAKTIFWSGPFGRIEEKEFQKGTEEIVKTISETRAFKVAGGGSTVFFIRNFKMTPHFNHLSTGGGAMFAFLAGEELPGIVALEKSEPHPPLKRGWKP